ncbi:hypothetical protein KR059_008857, partial [Drosophila kikkawai]
IRDMTNIKSVSPYDISSLKIIVPCARELSIEEAFKRIDVRSWLLHIVLVYAIFVAAETFILVVTYKISGQAYRLTILNPLVNLRAYRAILGISFPISRRASLSLRQLSLYISVFGLISSSFFSCKLSALLTKPWHHPQVDNFEELEASRLPVITSQTYRHYIESNVGVMFNLTRIKYVSQTDGCHMMIALNYSNAYFLFSEFEKVFKKYQKSFGRNNLCESRNLTFIQGLPMMYELKKNSIFATPIFRYLIRINEAGIMDHWMTNSAYYMRKALNHTHFKYNERKDEPLSIGHLKWVWCVLGCGHGIALITFVIEILLGGRRKESSIPTV